MTPGSTPGALNEIGWPAGAIELGLSAGDGPGTQRKCGACCERGGIVSTGTGATSAGGAYRGSLMGQRGICEDVVGIDAGGRNSSA